MVKQSISLFFFLIFTASNAFSGEEPPTSSTAKPQISPTSVQQILKRQELLIALVEQSTKPTSGNGVPPWLLQQLMDIQKELEQVKASQVKPSEIADIKTVTNQTDNKITYIEKLFAGTKTDQDDRIDDLGTYIAYVSIGLGIFGAILTIGALLLGFSAKRKAVSEAIKEANTVVGTWINEKSMDTVNSIQQTAANELMHVKDELSIQLDLEIEKGQKAIQALINESDGKIKNKIDDYSSKFEEILTNINDDKAQPDDFIGPNKKGISVEVLKESIAAHKRDEHAKSIELLNSIIQHDNSGPVRSSVLNLKALMQIETGNLESAEKTVDYLLEEYKNTTDHSIKLYLTGANLIKASIKSKKKEFSESIKLYDQVINKLIKRTDLDKKEKLQLIDALSESAEISLETEKKEKTISRINETLKLIKNDNYRYLVMQILKLILGEISTEELFNLTKNSPSDMVFKWNFTEIRNYLKKNHIDNKQEVESFINYIESHKNIDILEYTLNQLNEQQ